MNRLIVLIIVLLPYIVGVAQDGNSGRCFIRQDRVWLCTSRERGENTAKYMKFKESKEFHGKSYTRVSTIKKVKWDYGMTNIRIEEDIDETEAWMREDNGKVYLLLDSWEPSPYVDDSVVSTGQYEGVLYDFNADVDSSYDGIAQYRFYENAPGYYFDGFYKVLSVGTATVGGEEVKSRVVKFYLNGEDEVLPQVYKIVEGIGIVEYGGLYYLETYEHVSGDNDYNWFDCCMDLDGNILYPMDYNKELPGGGLPSSVITTEQPEAEAPLYDILGRRIANPAPGQLYIQGGKKRIAK